MIGNGAFAYDSAASAELLHRADSLRTSNHAEFAALLNRLDEESAELPEVQRRHLQYLQGWRSVYEGDYERAIPQLQAVIEESQDVTLGFRARATVVNTLALAKRYDEAFAHLSQMIELLPRISDPGAREQGLAIAAYLYNQVGLYEMGEAFATSVVEQSGTGRGGCNGRQLLLEALYESGKLGTAIGELQKGVDTCVAARELTYANVIRTYMVRSLLDRGQVDAAIKLLKEHQGEVKEARYPRMISEFDALLAQAYWDKGDAVLARTSALSAIENGVKNQYTEPLVSAYRLLYLLAKAQGDFDSALAFHEQFAIADKGYLDDVSARQLAFERVQHEALAGRLQIEALNKQNQVLQLQRALDRKAVENSRLYIALLAVCLLFIAFWAYKTKRSQLHFMKRSQQDGLTGIANRPHFIDQAERALQAGSRTQQDVCVILCDLDRFKAINDRYGHAAGDFVLQQAVRACQAHLRPNDLFGRLGGEEFGVLLAGCNAEQARLRSEQLREAIAAIPTRPGGMESRVSASLGIAATHTSGYELWQLLAHADAALYRAKRSGRNRVALFDADHEMDALSSGAPEEPARGFG